MASRKRLDSNRTRTPRENGRSNNNENGRTLKVFKTKMRMSILVPKMPAEVLKVDWTFVEIDFRGHIGRFQGLLEILDEEIGKTPDEIEAQKVKYGHTQCERFIIATTRAHFAK
jgi:hypothetical protein